MEDNKPKFLKPRGESTQGSKEGFKKALPFLDKELKLVFVNGNKYRRAQNILGLLKREVVPNREEDLQRVEHYSKQLAKHDITLDSKNALPAIYELLGGLIRTPAGQKKAEDRVQEMKAKAKKRAIE